MQSAEELKKRWDKISDFFKDVGKKIDDERKSGQDDTNTPEINPAKSLFGMLDPNASSMDAGTMLDQILGGFSSTISSMGRGVAGGFKINKSKIDGNGGKGGLFKQLIDLILGIVTLPMRFLNLFKAMTYAGGALGLGIGGIAKSFALGTKDVYKLIVAILKIVFKYALCIVSFWITTTLGGCIFVHVISLFFVMLHLLITYLVDLVHEYIGLDFTFIVDEVFEKIKWPSPIQSLCYTCFGKPVKLRDVLSDVSVIEQIGKDISYDFNHNMPRYMKPSIPFGQKSLRNLDKAMN
jgi:hypothetical protein